MKRSIARLDADNSSIAQHLPGLEKTREENESLEEQIKDLRKKNELLQAKIQKLKGK